MLTRPARHRRLLGAAAALVAVLLSALAVVVWRDGPTRAADFGAMSAASPAAPATDRPGAPGPGPSARRAEAADDPAPAPVAAPRQLSLPRLGLRAPVDAVGVAEDGQTEVPEDPDRVGWYRFSPAPGSDEGSSVIVGHVDSKNKGLGVLNALNEVREGDVVRVGRADGSTVSYEITARRTVGKKDLAASGAFRRDGRAVLTMITCALPYVRDAGGYQNNLVVTAQEVVK
ncbi:class F sortase [Streptomyces sp. NPDC060194]|uniref:class F sortase n=1 Tax=Streptomyces sp. NPDC060194 TaxID=3347069 RepID=UPI00364BBEFE